jgi:hypothetical protein
MAPRWLCRIAVLATITVIVLIPSAAANADGAAVNAGGAAAKAEGEGAAKLVGPLPVTAAQVVDGALGCTDWATGLYADQDLWRFQLGTGRFVSVMLGFFDGDGVKTTRSVEGIDGATAWIATPAGWSLASGTAVVNGDAGDFELARACPAAGVRKPAVAGLAPAVGGRSGTGARPATVQGATSTPRSLAAGTDIAATVTLGATLVLAGVLLLIVRRRPRGRHSMRGAR